MAAYTSTQSGNWNDAATWGGAGIPGASDTATITGQHTVTVPVGYSGTCGALALSAGASGTRTKLQINGTFDFAGAVTMATYSDLNLGAGATLDFNGNSLTRAASSICRFNWIGTAESRATVISTGSAGTIPVMGGLLTSDIQYCDISGMGNSEYGRTHTTGGALLNYEYSTWTGCGKVYLDGTGNQANQGFLVSRCDFRNPTAGAGTEYPYLYQAGAKGVNPRTLEYCTWDTDQATPIEPWPRAPNTTMTGCVLANAQITSHFNTLELVGNFFSNLLDGHILTESSTTARHALLDGNYVYQGPVSVHTFGYQVSSDSFAWTDNVFEVELGGTGYGTNWALSTAPFTGTVSITGNLWIGNFGTAITFTGAGAAGTVTLANNTFYGENYAQGDNFPTLLLTEQTGDITGGTISIYNNILLDPNSATAPDKAIFLRTNTAAQVDTCDYNCGWAYPAGAQTPPLTYADSDGAMSELGTNDFSLDARFVDRDRNLAAWDAFLGGPGTADNAISELLKFNSGDWNASYNVVDLVDWVRRGFAPLNADFATAGISADLVGAMDPNVLPLYAGEAPVLGVFLGTTQIKGLYLGATKLWPL